MFVVTLNDIIELVCLGLLIVGGLVFWAWVTILQYKEKREREKREWEKMNDERNH